MELFLEDLNKYPECTTNIKDIKLEDNQIISFITVNLDEHKKNTKINQSKKLYLSQLG